MVLSCLMWLLGTQVGSTVRPVSALNGALSPVPQRGASYWLAAHDFLTCCFIEPKTPGMIPPTMGWVCPPHSLINKMSYRLTYSPDLRRYFLNSGSCLSNEFRCISWYKSIQPRGPGALFWTHWAPGRHVVHRQACLQDIHTHKEIIK